MGSQVELSKSITKKNNADDAGEGEDDDNTEDAQEDETVDTIEHHEEEEENKDEEDENNEEEEIDEDAVEDVNQEEINRNWIKALDINYPLKTYYKHLKNSLQILLGSERIPSRQYPSWSENLFKTFKRLSDAHPEIQCIYMNLNIDEA